MEAVWAFDTFVAPIFDAIKQDILDASIWRRKYRTYLEMEDQGACVRRKQEQALDIAEKLTERAELYRFPDWSEDFTGTLSIPKKMQFNTKADLEAATAYYHNFDLGYNPHEQQKGDKTPPWAKDGAGNGALWKYLNSKHRIGGSFWERYGHATLPSDP